jgi:hypothetical protein
MHKNVQPEYTKRSAAKQIKNGSSTWRSDCVLLNKQAYIRKQFCADWRLVLQYSNMYENDLPHFSSVNHNLNWRWAERSTNATRIQRLEGHEDNRTCNTTIRYFFFTRWFKYDRDKLWLVYTQIVPVIFEPPCMSHVSTVEESRVRLWPWQWSSSGYSYRKVSRKRE